MGSWHDCAINGRILDWFGSGSSVADGDWRKKFFKREMVFHFHSHDSPLWQRIYSSATKQNICWFFVLKRNIQNVATVFAFFTVVDTRGFTGWNVNKFFILIARHNTSPIVSCSLWSTHNSFVSIFCWLKWEHIEQSSRRYKFAFSTNKKRFLSVFVVFTCSCNVKRTLWTKKQAPHFPQPKMDIAIVTQPSRDLHFSLLKQNLPQQ